MASLIPALATKTPRTVRTISSIAERLRWAFSNRVHAQEMAIYWTPTVESWGQWVRINGELRKLVHIDHAKHTV